MSKQIDIQPDDKFYSRDHMYQVRGDKAREVFFSGPRDWEPLKDRSHAGAKPISRDHAHSLLMYYMGHQVVYTSTPRAGVPGGAVPDAWGAAYRGRLPLCDWNEQAMLRMGFGKPKAEVPRRPPRPAGGRCEVSVQITGDPIGPRLTTMRLKRNEWVARMTFGADSGFDIGITIDDQDVDSHATDGAERPSARMVVGGIDDDDDSMCKVFRAFNENELRWLAKMCLTAASECKRLENVSRRKMKRANGGAK